MAKIIIYGVLTGMQIRNDFNYSFKGYDARKIKALCVGTTRHGIGEELSQIASKVGFDVFVPTYSGLQNVNNINRDLDLGYKLWLQDVVTTTPKNTVIPIFSSETLATFVSRQFNKILEYNSTKIPAGGNMFFIKNNKTAKEDLLLGADNAKDVLQSPEIKSILGVDKINIVPQMDFHIDMFLRPLEDSTILIADDHLTLRTLRLGLSRINTALSKPNTNRRKLKEVYNNLAGELREFRANVDKSPQASLEQTEKQLLKYGYNPVRVPGRIYSVDEQGSLRCTTNFMNAIVTKNDKNELVYITNKSLLDEKCGITPSIKKQINFSFEDEFLKSILAYIKPENGYFVRGKKDYIECLLNDSFGGIHCLCAEII